MEFDTLNTSSILRGRVIRREYFDPTNKKHKASLKKFVNTGSWGEIQFFPEAPYVNVPDTVTAKMLKHTLRNV